MKRKLLDKYIGCIVGAAIGDALGKQNEGIRREDIVKRGYIKDYARAPEGSPANKLRAGQYTDDTEQMLVLSRSLIACNGFDVLDFSSRIAKWGIEVMKDRSRYALLGPSSSSAIGKLLCGISWKESGSDIPSCGSAMRVAPVGLFFNDLDDVEKIAALSSVPTHKNKSAIAGAVAVAVAVRCALLGFTQAEIAGNVFERASNYEIGIARKIIRAHELRNEAPDIVIPELGNSFIVHDTVPCAFYFFSRYSLEPARAIIEAVNAGGDTDSIGCITGALCGAFCGIGAFSEELICGLEKKELLENIAIMIYKKHMSVRT